MTYCPRHLHHRWAPIRDVLGRLGVADVPGDLRLACACGAAVNWTRQRERSGMPLPPVREDATREAAR